MTMLFRLSDLLACWVEFCLEIVHVVCVWLLFAWLCLGAETVNCRWPLPQLAAEGCSVCFGFVVFCLVLFVLEMQH